MAANQPVIGSVGHVIQVDDSLVIRTKCHRGMHARERWVSFGYDTTTKKGFLHEVKFTSACGLQTVASSISPTNRRTGISRSTTLRNSWTPWPTLVLTSFKANVKMLRGILALSTAARLNYSRGDLGGYLWRERYGRDRLTAFVNVITHRWDLQWRSRKSARFIIFIPVCHCACRATLRFIWLHRLGI